MFTQMQKYHKAFLIGVTAIIAVSFGMTGAIFGLFDKERMTVAGSFAQGAVEINKQDFAVTHQRWQNYFEFVKLLSPKAEKIKSIQNEESLQQNFRLFYTQSPVWDAIYSLRENVAKLDQKLDEQMGQPEVWNMLLQGQINSMQLEAQFYISLSPKEREQATSRLSIQDAWNFFMLLHQAKEWGIVVTDEEVQIFLADAEKNFPGGSQSFQQRLRNANLLSSLLQKTTKEFLTILKYVNARTLHTKIPNETIQKQYAQFNMQYRFQWIALSHKSYLPLVTTDYAQEQQAFYTEVTKTNPEYFKIPAVADIEYLAISGNDFADEIQVSAAEINAAYAAQNPNENETVENIEQEKQKLGNELLTKKANAKAEETIRAIHNKIADLGESAALETIATAYKLEYKNLKDVPQDQFLADDPEKPDQAENLLYKTMAVGQISPMLTNQRMQNPYMPQAEPETFKKFFVFRVNRRQAAKLPSEEEVLKNETLFLERYYANNKAKFQDVERYRLAYVIADFENLRSNLVPTSKLQSEFYEKYKDQLYRAGDKHRPLQEVESDVQYRVVRLSAIQELHKLHELHRICKEKGDDLQLAPVVRELSHQIMLVPQAIRYTEDHEFRTADEIVQNNPTGDVEFNAPNNNTKLSDVKDCAMGKYFYKVLEVEKDETKEFAKIQTKIKDHFLKARALKRSETALKQWSEVYQQQQLDIRQVVEQNYQAKIAAAPNNSALETEKQQKLQALNSQLFQALALQKGVEFQESALMSKEQLMEDKPFKNIDAQVLSPIFAVQPNELAAPMMVEKTGEAILFQMLESKMPEITDISATEGAYIRELLWRRAYHSQIIGLISHESLKQELQFKDEGYFTDKELSTDDTRPVEEPLPATLPFDASLPE